VRSRAVPAIRVRRFVIDGHGSRRRRQETGSIIGVLSAAPHGDTLESGTAALKAGAFKNLLTRLARKWASTAPDRDRQRRRTGSTPRQLALDALDQGHSAPPRHGYERAGLARARRFQSSAIRRRRRHRVDAGSTRPGRERRQRRHNRTGSSFNNAPGEYRVRERPRCTFYKSVRRGPLTANTIGVDGKPLQRSAACEIPQRGLRSVAQKTNTCQRSLDSSRPRTSPVGEKLAKDLEDGRRPRPARTIQRRGLRSEHRDAVGRKGGLWTKGRDVIKIVGGSPLAFLKTCSATETTTFVGSTDAGQAAAARRHQAPFLGSRTRVRV